MAEIQDQLAAAFLELRDAVGVSITFDKATVQAVVTESQLSRDLVEGGFQSEADCVVKVLLADLPTVPTLGRLVRYKDKGWKVTDVNVQPGHLTGSFTIRPLK